MKKSFVCAIAVLSAVISSGACCRAAMTEKTSDNSQGRVIAIKTEIAETVINTQILCVLQGAKARMSIRTSVPQSPNIGAKSYDETSVTWLPTVTQDGNINLSGSLRFVRRGYRSQDVKLSAIVKPGEPQKLPVILVPAENSSESRLELALTVTATLLDSSTRPPDIRAR